MGLFSNNKLPVVQPVCYLLTIDSQDETALQDQAYHADKDQFDSSTQQLTMTLMYKTYHVSKCDTFYQLIFAVSLNNNSVERKSLRFGEIDF